MAAQHSAARVQAYVRLLKRFNAPEPLIADFVEIIAIDNGIAAERDGLLESLDRLLFDVCLRYNFARPFDQGNARAWIRPALIADDHPDSAGDHGGYGRNNQFDPVVEQAYRRGFDQGFADAARIAREGSGNELERRQAAIHTWRIAKVFFGNTRPGTPEPFEIKVALRSAVPAKLRWIILERDNHRCCSCGSGPSNGVTLHVDHIVSLFNGGTNDVENLQVLCEPCNLGKGRD